MAEKSQVLAYDREKNIYKDAYVDNFCKVRYFPTLASIGMGKSEGESIVLVEEDSGALAAPTKSIKRNEKELHSLESRSNPSSAMRHQHTERESLNPNSLERLFDYHPPLSCFRNQVLCKHSNARKEKDFSSNSNSPPINTNSPFSLPPSRSRYGSPSPPIFKRTSISEAKAAIQRKITYEHQASPSKELVPLRERQQLQQELSPVKQWKYSNPVDAKEHIRVKSYFNLPQERIVVADRKYIQEFIKRNVQAYQANRQPPSSTNQH